MIRLASGDIRNLVTTIASVPGSYKQNIAVTLNDKDPDIVARNAVMLLIFLTTVEPHKAISCVMHVWYSSLIHTEHMQLLCENVYPLVEDVCSKIRNKSQHTLLGKTWTFGGRTLRAVLSREVWMALLQILEPPAGLTLEKANGIRTAVTLAAERQDYLDRKLAVMEPAHRVCVETFRKDGLLLPLGYSRKGFTVPNPFVLLLRLYLDITLTLTVQNILPRLGSVATQRFRRSTRRVGHWSCSCNFFRTRDV